MRISGIPRLLVLFVALLSSVLLFPSCRGSQKSKSAPPVLITGEARLAVHGGNIWYKITGTPKGTPVVLLHGGPGFSSFYLKPFEDLGDDRQVVRYDQLGGGKSDKITDTTMFTIEHFVRELDSLRAHLGVTKWHVFGHSWGTILAIEGPPCPSRPCRIAYVRQRVFRHPGIRAESKRTAHNPLQALTACREEG